MIKKTLLLIIILSFFGCSITREKNFQTVTDSYEEILLREFSPRERDKIEIDFKELISKSEMEEDPEKKLTKEELERINYNLRILEDLKN